MARHKDANDSHIIQQIMAQINMIYSSAVDVSSILTSLVTVISVRFLRFRASAE
jgi:hypothetical protein